MRFIKFEKNSGEELLIRYDSIIAVLGCSQQAETKIYLQNGGIFYVKGNFQYVTSLIKSVENLKIINEHQEVKNGS